MLAIVLVLAMVLPGIAQAATLNAEEDIRIAGANRWETAAAASKDAYSSADTVIIVDGRNFPDALTGTVLAATKNAPLLLVDSKNDVVPAAVKAEITRLGATKAIIVGGPVAVSEKIKTDLEKDLTVTRVAGDNRYATAIEVAEEAGVNKGLAFLVNGQNSADALAIGPVAAMKNAPIFLTKAGELNAATKEALKDYDEVVVIGGAVAVSAAVFTEADADLRVEGTNRYKTALEVAKKYFAGASKAYVANGKEFADALVGGYLGAKNSAPVLLTKADSIEAGVLTYLEDKDVTVLGGKAAVSDKVVDEIVGEEEGELKVVSVSAINGAQVEVKFSKAVDKTTTEAASFTLNPLDSQGATTLAAGAGSLSKDGKTLTLTASQPLQKRYQLTFANIQLASDSSVTVDYDDIVTFKADTTAPTATVERVSTNALKIKFSEPMKASAGTISAKYADGTAVTGLTLAVPGTVYTEIEVDLSAGTVIDNKNIEITLNGVADMAGNLINPQPTKLTVVRLPNDGIEPAITSVTQTGAKTFNIKFNKDLAGLAFTADGVEVDVSGVTAVTGIDKVSASEYKVTVDTNLDGLLTVTVKANKAVDLAGQDNTNDLTKLVTFKEDTVAPKATAKLVKVDGAEYIELTFDKDVAVTASSTAVDITGTHVKDYVTTPVSSSAVTVEYKDTNNKKVVLVPLTDSGVLDVEGAAYDVTLSANAGNPVASEAGVDMEDVKVQFTRGKDAAAANSLVIAPGGVAVAQGSTPDEVVVTFTLPVGATGLDGATAANKANYSIAGATIESVEVAAASAGTQDVTLNLVKNSNTFTGVRNITVENVKVAGSTKVMDPETITGTSLAENIRPTITKAELTDTNKITLTFSEVVSNANDTAGADFDLYIGNTKSAKTVAVETVAVNSEQKTLEVTITAALTAEEVAKGISLKSTSNINIDDEVGNTVAPVTVNVTSN